MNAEIVLLKYQRLHFFEDYVITSFDDPGMDGETPVHIACLTCDPESLCVMLAAGASVDKRGGIGNTPLHYAVMASCVTCALILVQAGANVDAANDYGDTPRDLAMRRSVEIQRALRL